MFVCYLDDSDDQLSSVQTMAGYFGTLEAWKSFEDQTAPIFERYGATVFHARDFHATKGEFRGWSRIKKESFATEVYAVAGKFLSCGIGRSIRKAAYKRIKRETGKNPSMSAYGVLFASIMHATIRGNSLAQFVKEEGMSFVVESGHKNNAEIEQYFHEFKSHEMFSGIARTITFASKDSSRAVQLADFFAFYARRFASVSDQFDGKLALPTLAPHSIMCSSLPHYEYVIRNPYGAEVTDWQEGDYR